MSLDDKNMLVEAISTGRKHGWFFVSSAAPQILRFSAIKDHTAWAVKDDAPASYIVYDAATQEWIEGLPADA